MPGYPHSTPIIIGGRRVPVPAGDPLDIAVLKSTGFTGLTMSVKYRRPRHPFCHHEWCPGNEAVVDGRLVNPTETYPKQGMHVAEACPLSSIMLSRLHRLLGPGFYHKFYVRMAWPLARRIIAGAAGLPSLREAAWGEPTRSKLEHMNVDVLVVGGGIAGLKAASAAAKSGASVLLVEAHRDLGGRQGFLERNTIGRLLEDARDKGVRILPSTLYLGRFPEGYVLAEKPHRRLIVVEAHAMIYAGGSMDPIPLMGNNDLPGIISSDYALRILGYGYTPKRAVILASRLTAPWAFRIASIIISRGASVAIISREPLRGAPTPSRAEVYDNVGVITAQGRCSVRGVKLSSGERIRGDMVVSALRRHPLIQPLLQLGAKPMYCRRSRTIVAQPPPGVFVVGEAGGGCMDAGDPRSIGEHASEYARRGGGEQRPEGVDDVESVSVEQVAEWLSGRVGGMQFLCLCSDVTLQDLVETYRVGYESMEKIKRYSALGTGPCQGKACMTTAALILSKITGRSIGSIGLFRQRTPIMPVEIALLGAEP